MQFDFPKGPPGIHPPTAALKKILQFRGVLNPIIQKPYSEAVLLGVGGGLDIGYILFQFAHLPNPMLLLGFRNQWNNTLAFLENLTERLNLLVDFLTFSDEKSAETALQENLRENRLAIVWVDQAHLPYHHLPESLRGYITHQVAVYARDGRLWRLYLDDLSTQPIEVREKDFTTARANLSLNNYPMMVFYSAGELTPHDLRESLRSGINACATQLLHPLKTIGISNLETWSEKLVDRHDHQGWLNIFKNTTGLFPVLRSIYESIKRNGTGGFALRKLYSDFLHVAAGMQNNPALNAIAGQYLQLSNHWANLAENALPSRISEFDRIKNLINKKYDAFRQYDLKTYKKSINDLQALETTILGDFPLDYPEITQLFEKLSSQVKLISELEFSAAQRLRDISRR